jgi:hypothetical protein
MHYEWSLERVARYIARPALASTVSAGTRTAVS